MTVCIAAIADDGTFLCGASDRLLTSPNDVGHETHSEKFEEIVKNIIVLKSGWEDTNCQVFDLLKTKIKDVENNTPNKVWKVKEVVSLYLDSFNEVTSEYAQRQYLSPHQLTHNTFLSKQDISEKIGDKLYNKIQGVSELEIFNNEVIFAGKDNEGCHLCVIERNIPLWRTSQGYAVIGSGASHAESQLMNANHSPNDPNDRAMLNVFFAKKRAEVVRSVGSKTDMFYFFTELEKPKINKLNDSWIQKFEEDYDNAKSTENEAFEKSVEKLNKTLDDMSKKDAEKEKSKNP